MVFGIFLGIFPLIIIIINGYVLGFVANQTAMVFGGGILWRLLPHGIFEIPAIMIAVGLGLKLGISLIHNCIIFYNKNISIFLLYILIVLSILFFPISIIILIILTIINRELWGNLRRNLMNSLRAFILVVIPLLVVAGIIEGLLIFLLG